MPNFQICMHIIQQGDHIPFQNLPLLLEGLHKTASQNCVSEQKDESVNQMMSTIYTDPN